MAKKNAIVRKLQSVETPDALGDQQRQDGHVTTNQMSATRVVVLGATVSGHSRLRRTDRRPERRRSRGSTKLDAKLATLAKICACATTPVQV